MSKLELIYPVIFLLFVSFVGFCLVYSGGWGALLSVGGTFILIGIVGFVIVGSIVIIYEQLKKRDLVHSAVIIIILAGICIWALSDFVDKEFPPLSDYLSGDVVPKDWSKGEWMNYTANHPDKAKTVWFNAKTEHDNHYVRQRFHFLKGD